jgi:Protein of unknown function (DUF4058)
MNPYLEHPELWAEVHSRLIIYIADQIAPSLRPKYRVAVEKRVYQDVDESVLVGIPDVTVARSLPDTRDRPSNGANVAVVAPPTNPMRVTVPMPEDVRESFLEVRAVGTGAVVTVIEILSPKNKRSGEGRQAYDRKRQQILGSLTHLIEIDLLRAGQPMPILGTPMPSAYRILVSRSNRRPTADLYAFGLRDPIPAFPLPLRPGDPEPLVDIQTALHTVYDRAGLDMAIDYTAEPVPPLAEAEKIWAIAYLSAPAAPIQPETAS